MSAGKKSGLRPFTSATAPRGGRVKGSKNWLSAEFLRVINRLLSDWKRHGSKTLKILRVENPAVYAKLVFDVASRVTLAEMGADGLNEPTLLVVRWGDPRNPPPPPPEVALPPEPPHGPPPPAGPAKAAPRLLTLISNSSV